MTTGGDSVFDMRVDGELIFSKHELGRLAEDGEVLGIFRGIVGRTFWSSASKQPRFPVHLYIV